MLARLPLTAVLASFSLLLLLLLSCPSSSSAQSSTQTLYWTYSITNGTSVFGGWSVCASGTLTVGTTTSTTNLLSRAAVAVYGITGQRVFTNAAGSTVPEHRAVAGQ